MMYASRTILLDLDVRDAAVDEGREEVAHVEDPDDVVERLPVDRVARVRRVDDRGKAFLGRQVDGQRHDVGPRHHHLRDLLVGEVEDLVEHLLLLLLELAALGGSVEEHLQLGLGESAALLTRRLEPEDAQYGVGRVLEHPDQRPHQDEEPADGPGDEDGGRLRVPQGDSLGNELADHDVQVGDDEERERERDDRGRDRFEDVREDGLAESTDGQARDGHAELHRGDEARRVRRDVQDEARAAVALVAELGDAGATRRDEAVLGRHEERVQQEEPCDRDQLE